MSSVSESRTDVDLTARAAQALFSYARAVDEGDIETLRGLAEPDVQLTRSDGTSSGVEAFLDLYRAFRDSPVQGSKHVVTNVQAHREADGLVRARAYFEATMFDPDGTRIVIGQYSDSLREDGGELRFAHKRISVERVVQLAAATSDWAGVTVPGR
jgi:3-phenylpropionate/cinnamic acid dioxygenase small subunit